jgi:hypothetical protein
MVHDPTPRHDRGTTLIEAMVSLSILLIGILGMMQLQVLGVTATSGGRAQTTAYALARELAASLEQLSPDDPLIVKDFEGDVPPAQFGHLLIAPNTLSGSGFKTWADGNGMRGVTTDAAIVAEFGYDPIDAAPRFQRRWQVWQMATAAADAGVKGIAVSVTYREPKLPTLREVVLLTQVSNKGLSSAFASAYR